MPERTLLIAAAALCLAACGGDDAAPDTTARPARVALDVYVVNYPLQYFAERIGGERVDVRFPAPPDEDPAFWTPDAATITDFQGADLILANGAGYADWIAMATLPFSAIVDTSTAFEDDLILLDDVVTHSHGPDGDHEHGDHAFTTWLDPALAVEQARAIATAFARALPEYEAEFRERLATLEADLGTLDRRLAAAADAIGDRPLIFSHPVYQYLERRYGLHGRSLHWEPERAPDLAELEQLRANHPAVWLVWEARPADTTVAQLKTAGVASIVVAPCANVPPTGDYLTVMRENAAALERVAAGARP